MKKMFSIVLVSSVLISCASVHSGHMAKDEKGRTFTQGGLSVSGIEDSSFSSKYFLALDFSVENSTADWIVLDEASLTFTDSNTTSKMMVHAKKWITLYAKDPMGFPFIRDLELSIKLKNGQNYKFEIPFRRNMVARHFSPVIQITKLNVLENN